MIKIDDWYITDRQIGGKFRPGLPIHLRLTSNSIQCFFWVLYVCIPHIAMITKYLDYSSNVISYPSSSLDHFDFHLF